MTDKDVVDRIQKLVGYGNIYTIESDGVRKVAYKWQIGARANVEDFISLVLPYMGDRRREKFSEAKQFYTDRDIRNTYKHSKTGGDSLA